MLRGSGPREAAAGQEKQIFTGPDERLQGLLHKGSGAVSCSQPRDKCHRCCTFRRSQAALQLYLQRDGFRCIGVSVIAPPPPPSLPPYSRSQLPGRRFMGAPLTSQS